MDRDPILEVLDARARAHAFEDDSFSLDDDAPKTSRGVTSSAEATPAPAAAIVRVKKASDEHRLAGP